jgi:hypothetical protein
VQGKYLAVENDERTIVGFGSSAPLPEDVIFA